MNKPPDPDPFEDDEPPVERRKVFNPRRRRWEWGDTGEPAEGPATVKKAPAPKQQVGNRKMGFGKFADHYVEEVPTWYLNWVLAECEDRRNGLHEEIERELQERGDD